MRHASECNLCDDRDRSECGWLLFDIGYEDAVAGLVEEESSAVIRCDNLPFDAAVAFDRIGSCSDDAVVCG